ncbi:MAG: hypothetical protein GF370_02840 [Candidatus Nealsonbacteria bacterium]|nr:hypothetical protein [Candidatus Nealsonbacteria bacterium]
MKLLLTSNGFNNNPIIKKEFLRLVGKDPSEIVVFLVNIADRESKDWKHVELNIQELEEIGVLPENITVFSLDKEVDKSDLEKMDVVFVCGGNTFEYLDRIKKTKLDSVVKEFVNKGGLYFGISAGSYVVCPTINAANWEPPDNNSVGLRDLSGLNLVSFLIVAHFEKKYHATIEKSAAETEYPVIAINDNQAILVDGKDIRVIGPKDGDINIF